jgi:type 1 glutamine amidotransferase
LLTHQKILEQKEKDKFTQVKVRQMTEAFADQKAKEAERKYGESANLVVRLKDRAQKAKSNQNGGDGLVGFNEGEDQEMDIAA